MNNKPQISNGRRQTLLNAFKPVSPGSDYTLKANPSLAELNSKKAVAVYIEAKSHDTTDGAKWIIENTKTIGEDICKGLCNYFGLSYKSASPSFSGKLYRMHARII